MIQIRISEDAIDDLQDGFFFYEAQEQGLGDYFTTCLRADIESLRITACMHRLCYSDYHRLLSRVFPYGIFTPGRAALWMYGRSWICGESRNG